MKKRNSLKAFCDALRRGNDFLMTCHVSPEGDAVGSILAMDSLVRRLGKKSTVVCDDVFPERLAPCLSDKRWNTYTKLRASKKRYKYLVAADCPNLDRIGRVQKLLTKDAVIFNLDHHVSNRFFGHYNYVRPNAAASGEVVMDIFKQLRVPLTKYDARNIYVALTTDTGSFRYSNTTIQSHLKAAELIKTGIDLEKINEELYSTYSKNKIELTSRLLSRVRVSDGGKVAWASLTQSDLKRTKAKREDAEGFIDFLRFIKSVKIAAFLSEEGPGEGVRVSLRSKSNCDVNRIANHFGGGGHKKASGCTLHMPLKKAEKALLKRIRKEFSAA